MMSPLEICELIE